MLRFHQKSLFLVQDLNPVRHFRSVDQMSGFPNSVDDVVMIFDFVWFYPISTPLRGGVGRGREFAGEFLD
jgi:hypothetical protein